MARVLQGPRLRRDEMFVMHLLDSGWQRRVPYLRTLHAAINICAICRTHSRSVLLRKRFDIVLVHVGLTVAMRAVVYNRRTAVYSRLLLVVHHVIGRRYAFVVDGAGGRGRSRMGPVLAVHLLDRRLAGDRRLLAVVGRDFAEVEFGGRVDADFGVHTDVGEPFCFP